jgi:nitrite reductase (NAD(P)H)
LIATEKGFNVFVAGNGGAKPKHCELLAKDVPPAEVIPILDRYLMFYIRTADKLQRTARWLENLPGGLKYLQEVVLEDKLGICASLEAQMQELVDSYFDEWAEAINNPTIAAKFKQFANTDETIENMEVEVDRDQTRPVYWSKDSATEDFKGLKDKWSSTTWQPVIEAAYFDGADQSPNGISATIKRGDTQLAVWRIRGRYYATQQMCPHKRAFVLSDGLIGEDLNASASSCSDAAKPDSSCSVNGSNGANGANGTNGATTPPKSAPWVSCPYHKRNFDLADGDCKNDEELSIATFPVEERADGLIYLKLPPVEELDAALGTAKWKVKKGESGAAPFEELDKKINFIGQRAKKVGVKSTLGIIAPRKPAEIAVGGGCGSAPDW